MGAMKVCGWWNDPSLSVRVRVNAPARSYVVRAVVLVKWFLREGRTPREAALKVKMGEMVSAK